jgi:hemerythrin-like domain-containing protein
MAHIAAYLKQHAELLGIAGQISEKLNIEAIENDIKSIVDLLTVFSLKLFFHLSMEDKVLYPNILNSPVDGARETAQKFIEEMGGISETFKTYRDKWSTSLAIQANPDRFISETNSLLTALGNRISREEKELYILA